MRLPTCQPSVAIVIAAVTLAACVEIAGVFYDLRFSETPSNDDCLILAHAVTARLTNLKITDVESHGGNCSVYVSDPHLWMIIGAVRQEKRLNLQIRGPSADRLADEIVKISQETFPGAEVVRVHPKQGLGP